MSDLAGNDVGWRIRQRKLKDWPANKRYSTLADKICEQGRFGQKTGAGWYVYESGSRTPKPDPAVEALIVEHSKAESIPRREISDEEILKRCLYALINEGAQILDEGIAIRAVDIDITYLYGYGFPRYRGGPMFTADQVGLGEVYKTIVDFHERFGDDWAPAPLLKRLAEEGKGFGEL